MNFFMMCILMTLSDTPMSVFENYLFVASLVEVAEYSSVNEFVKFDIGWIETSIGNTLVKYGGRTDPIEPEHSGGLAKSTKRPEIPVRLHAQQSNGFHSSRRELIDLVGVTDLDDSSLHYGLFNRGQGTVSFFGSIENSHPSCELACALGIHFAKNRQDLLQSRATSMGERSRRGSSQR
jgi:hypothetical protein